MKASLFYRIAAVLLLFFAVGTYTWFSPVRSNWELIPCLAQCGQFTLTCRGVAGHIGTFCCGWTLCRRVYLFAAILAWQLGGSGRDFSAHARHCVGVRCLLCSITVVSWRYLFILPIVFSMVITVCLDCGSMAFSAANLKAVGSRVFQLGLVNPTALSFPAVPHHYWRMVANPEWIS